MIEVYGLDASASEVVETVVLRLRSLAAFSHAAAVELGKPELAEHVAGYRADAVRIGQGRLSP